MNCTRIWSELSPCERIWPSGFPQQIGTWQGYSAAAQIGTEGLPTAFGKWLLRSIVLVEWYNPHRFRTLSLCESK